MQLSQNLSKLISYINKIRGSQELDGGKSG